MILLLGILAVAIVASGVLIFMWARLPNESRSEGSLRQRRARSLFDEPSDVLELSNNKADARAHILERAARGDLSALDEALRASDPALYAEALDVIVERCSEDAALARVISHITKSAQFRSTALLALRLSEAFKSAPSPRSAAYMLHVAALSDDAAVYRRAVDALLETWQGGRLSQFSAEDIQQLIESQFWVLAPEARRSGAGFLLKRRLAGIRRALAAATPAR